MPPHFRVPPCLAFGSTARKYPASAGTLAGAVVGTAAACAGVAAGAAGWDPAWDSGVSAGAAAPPQATMKIRENRHAIRRMVFEFGFKCLNMVLSSISQTRRDPQFWWQGDTGSVAHIVLSDVKRAGFDSLCVETSISMRVA